MTAAVRAVVERLARLAPVFRARPEQLHLLASPCEFYTFLLDRIGAATSRVALATLYLGTGEAEASLVEALRGRMAATDGALQVHIHMDYLRGSRGFPRAASSLTTLQPLLAYPQVTLSMYRTPLLDGGWRRWVPHRWNEVFGLSHLKVFVIDQTVLITGANLSESYFRDRADRYLCITDHPKLADYFSNLLRTIASLSFQLRTPATPASPLQWGGPQVDASEAGQALEQFIAEQITMNPSLPLNAESPTDPPPSFILPTIQMAPHGILQDQHVLTELMQFVQSHLPSCQPTLATGYFNLAPLAQHIFSPQPPASSQGDAVPWRIITSSPQANGFYQSPGLSGYIPDAYRSLELAFLRSRARPPLARNAQGEEALFEYARDGWTFHAKGLWLDAGPDMMATVVGSSNFGHRSFFRDLEAQLTLITSSPEASRAIQQDRDRLFQWASPVSAREMGEVERQSLMPVTRAVHLLKSFL